MLTSYVLIYIRTALINALSTTQSKLTEDIATVQRQLQTAADQKAENESG